MFVNRAVLHERGWFSTGVMAACRLFASQPRAGRRESAFGPEVRTFIVNPYLVVYRPLGRSIEILRVIHGARDRDAAWHEPSNGDDPPVDL